MSSMSFIWCTSGDQTHNRVIAKAENKACPQIQKFAATSWLYLTQTAGSFLCLLYSSYLYEVHTIVCTATRILLGQPRNHSSSPRTDRVTLSSKAVRLALEPTESPILWLKGVLPPAEHCGPGTWSWLSPPARTKVKHSGNAHPLLHIVWQYTRNPFNLPAYSNENYFDLQPCSNYILLILTGKWLTSQFIRAIWTVRHSITWLV